ncbi:ABC transporter G family member 53 [Hondaea fermentalgiana]|uniref:ABC transporter G family member 53 n=1 Tax=Hondaea fermentalgiana TaxID=2315210 RepID=A0A2R5H1L5_9STRA|nr:ABC transporter G family member 53 [Hondaea fermentalgiana]|eukprot:GBG34973.1 ABC transporter G family member 53 [Hondaea fermentalgiana]
MLADSEVPRKVETETETETLTDEEGDVILGEDGTAEDDAFNVEEGESRRKAQRPNEEEATRIRALLGRLQKQAQRQNTTDKEKVQVTLTSEEVGLLGQLMDQGLIRAPSRLGTTLGPVDRQMTMVQYANMVARAEGDDTWPVNLAFQNLTYSVNVRKVDVGISTVGTTFYKMLTPFFACDKSRRLDLPILRNVSGVFEAGKSTLVLGPPGCGVSSLFKVLSGRAKTGHARKLSGDIFYSGFTAKEIYLRKLITFIGQVDVHCPVLTVRETLQFAYDCFGGPEMAQHVMTRSGVSDEISEEEWAHIREQLEDLPQFIIDNLALTNAADTIVGDELLRGVSGGEKKRVTSAEMLMGRRPIALYDQISTGLDSAATFDICRRITGVAKSLALTPVVALLQPPPETYSLFDEILILALGHIVFHGPREDVLPYFSSIGFDCPHDRDIADFIQEVTTPARTRYQTHANAPSDEEEMARAWLESPFSQKKRDATAFWCNPGNKIESPVQRELYSVNTPVYANSFCKELNLIFVRQLKLTFRDGAFLAARIGQAIVMGVFMGSIFLDLDPNLPTSANDDQTPATQRFGILFAVLMQSLLSGLAQMPVVLAQRPVYYKQSGSFFFRTINYVLSETAVVLPIALVESILLATLVFFLSALVPWGDATQTGVIDTGARFMLFVVVLFAMNFSFGGYLRAIGAISPTPSISQVLAAISIGSTVLFSGYIITADQIPVWFIWIYWLSPIGWAFRSACLVIFGSKAFTDAQRTYSLSLFGVTEDDKYLWGGILMLLAYGILYVFISFLTYEYVRYEDNGGRQTKAGPDAEDTHDPEVAEVERVWKERNTSSMMEIGNRPIGAVEDNKSGASSANTPADNDVAVRVHTSLAQEDFEPADLVFRDLWYSVQGPEDSKGSYNLDLLKGITGYAEAGTLTALMGSSGAGKSTLMDVLALRKTGGKIRGEVLVNGRPQEKTSFSRVIGYVEQMDIHSPNATVHEAITFSAYLRQPARIPRAEKDRFVEQVIDTLKLENIRDFAIGFKTSGGLTTEQAKRVTIAVELAANPAIIFADEPTSGLDANSARIVMDGLDRIARAGRTVVCTIHQPSKDIFMKFDRLLLLRRGGEMVYFGDLGQNSQKLLDYLAAIPGTELMPNPRYNPATYMLEAIGASAGKKVKADYAAEYRESDLRRTNDEAIETLIQRNLEERRELHFDDGYASTFATQADQLMKRWWLSFWRNPGYNTTRVLVSVVIAIFFGFSFFRNGLSIESSSDVQSFIGLLYHCSTFMGVIALNTAIPTIMDERAPFYRERAANFYSVTPMVIAQTLSEFPYLLFTTLLYVSIFYFIVYLYHDAVSFFLFWFAYFLLMMTMTFWGHLLATACPNDQVANVMGGVSLGFWSISSGLMIAWDDIPGFWQWLVAINPIRYALNALVVSQLSCEDASATPMKPGCFELDTGQIVWEFTRENFGYEAHDWKFCIGALAGFAGGFRIITALCYTYVSYLKR